MPIMNGYHGSTWTQLYKIIEVFQEPSIIIDFFRSVQNVRFFLPSPHPLPKVYIINVDPKMPLIFLLERGGSKWRGIFPLSYPFSRLSTLQLRPPSLSPFLFYSLPFLIPSILHFIFSLLFFSFFPSLPTSSYVFHASLPSLLHSPIILCMPPLLFFPLSPLICLRYM